MTASHQKGSATPPAGTGPSEWWRLPVWLLAGFLAAAVLSVTASFAPAEMKRLLLYYVVYGIACGAVLHWLSIELRPGTPRLLPYFAGVICLVGALNLGFLSYRHFEQGRQKLALERPKDVEILKTLRSASEQDPEVYEQYSRELRQFSPRFDDYLRHRVSSLGEWNRPWPELFWGFEVLLSAIASGITLFLMGRQPQRQIR